MSTGLEPRTPVLPSNGLALSLALTFPSSGGAPDLGEGAQHSGWASRSCSREEALTLDTSGSASFVGEMAEASAGPISRLVLGGWEGRR